MSRVKVKGGMRREDYLRAHEVNVKAALDPNLSPEEQAEYAEAAQNALDRIAELVTT